MATLDVVTSYPRFAFGYALTSPTITINGKLEDVQWGLSRFELAPGEYDVAVAVPSLFRSQRGRNIIFIRLLEGDLVRVVYTAPRYSMMPGTISIDVTVPTARLV